MNQTDMNEQYQLMMGDCLALLKTLPDNSVDAIVTDPPYGLGKEPDPIAMLSDWMTTGHHEVKGKGFMGKTWDAFVPQPAQWAECCRVLKPGGHLLAFAGTRTQDLMCLGLRIAGFEIRDLISYMYSANDMARGFFDSMTPDQIKMFELAFGNDAMAGWCYGSGFPKSLDISKALDKAAGAKGTLGGPKSEAHAGWIKRGATRGDGTENEEGWQRPWMDDPEAVDAAARTHLPATDAAKKWQGFGTALKPAIEPITLARKPLHGTVAANVMRWGTGGINVDGCRVEGESVGVRNNNTSMGSSGNEIYGKAGAFVSVPSDKGRFPANLIHDGSDEVIALFPNTKSGTISPHHQRHTKGGNGNTHGDMAGVLGESYGDSGSAARFFYQAKCSKADRNEGCEKLPDQEWRDDGTANPNREDRPFNPSKNNHPTVKPTGLMRYLCRLVTPPGGVVLDPFMGSGSTGKAAMLEGFRFIGMDLSEEYVTIATARIRAAWEAANCDDL